MSKQQTQESIPRSILSLQGEYAALRASVPELIPIAGKKDNVEDAPESWPPQPNTDPGPKPEDSHSTATEFVRFGAFAVKPETAPVDYRDEVTGFAIQEGDFYLGFHMLPVAREDQTPGFIRDSLSRLAEYTREEALEPDTYIAGDTYARLGRAAARSFGLHSFEIPLDETLIGPNPDLHPTVVFSTVGEFQERYSALQDI